MIRMGFICLAAGLSCGFVLAADAPNLGQVLDARLSTAERDIVPLVEAMPAGKFDFVPAAGEFKGVRTFGQQARHLATAIYMMSSAILGQKPPVDIGKTEDGPESVRSKEEVLKYLRGAFTFAHKALSSVTEKNELDMVPTSTGGKQIRLGAAIFILSHSYDHYGQMVVYLRMNGIIPPASQPAH